MELTDRIASILEQKDRKIWSVAPETSVFEALSLMADKNIGALAVISRGDLAGIISERDYARKIILMGRSSRETRVEEIMTSPPITVTPERTVAECMELITNSRVRHLPVVESGRLVGIVSIGDLVNWIITSQRETIEHLHAYISGSYPA